MQHCHLTDRRTHTVTLITHTSGVTLPHQWPYNGTTTNGLKRETVVFHLLLCRRRECLTIRPHHMVRTDFRVVRPNSECFGRAHAVQ